MTKINKTELEEKINNVIECIKILESSVDDVLGGTGNKLHKLSSIWEDALVQFRNCPEEEILEKTKFDWFVSSNDLLEKAAITLYTYATIFDQQSQEKLPNHERQILNKDKQLWENLYQSAYNCSVSFLNVLKREPSFNMQELN